MREKIETRRGSHPVEDKEFILSKSHCKCSHCGKKLSIKSEDFTVDHFIPLNKGGTNDIENLIALCDECNKIKSDYVVNPANYCHYFSDFYIDELKEHYDKYCNSVKWTSPFNILREELVFFKAAVIHPKMKGFKGHLPKNIPTQEFIVKKAKNTDVPLIKDFVREYNTKYYPNTDVDNIIDMHIKDGPFYLVYKKDELLAAIPINIGLYNCENIEYYGVFIPGIIFKYKKVDYFAFLDQLFHVIIKFLLIDLPGLEMFVSFPKKDEFLMKFFYMQEIYYKNCTINDHENTKDVCIAHFPLLSPEYKDYNPRKIQRMISEEMSKKYDLPALSYRENIQN